MASVIYLSAIYRRIVTFGFTIRHSDFSQKVAGIFATRLLLVAVGLLTSVVISRILGPEGRGMYAVAFTFTALGIQFGCLGLSSSIIYFASRDPSTVPKLLGNTLMVCFGLGGIGVLLAWIIFFYFPHLSPVHGPLLVIALLGIPFGLAYLLFQSVFLGIQQVGVYNKITLGNRLLMLAMIGLLIYLHVVVVETVFAVSVVATVLGFGWTYYRLRNDVKAPPQLSVSLFKKTFDYGLRAYLSGFFAFLVLRVDLLMVKHMLGISQTGYYSVAGTMADILYLFPAAVASILYPKLSAMSSDKEKVKITKRIAALTISIMTASAIVAIMLAAPLLRVIFGEKFMPALPAFHVLAIAIIFFGVNNIFSIGLASMNFPWFAVYIWLIAAILNIGLNLFLIPWKGILGASIASLISYFFLMVVHYVYLTFWCHHES